MNDILTRLQSIAAEFGPYTSAVPAPDGTPTIDLFATMQAAEQVWTVGALAHTVLIAATALVGQVAQLQAQVAQLQAQINAMPGATADAIAERLSEPEDEPARPAAPPPAAPPAPPLRLVEREKKGRRNRKPPPAQMDEELPPEPGKPVKRA